MDAGFDFSFQGSVIGWLAGRGRTVAFDRYLQSRETVRAGYRLAHFLSSHDVPGGLYLLNGDRVRFRLAVVLQMTVAGVPTIDYGEEVARPGGDWPDNRSDMPWGDRAVLPGAGLPRDEGLRADYRRLIALRRAHRALQVGRHRPLSSDGDLLVFARLSDDGDAAVVAVNRGASPARAEIAAPESWSAEAAVRDALSGAELPVRQGKIALEVPALGAMILERIAVKEARVDG
jgi:alpha-amylase